LTILEPDALSFDNIEEIQTYVESHGGHAPSFLSSKIKSVNEDLADKWLLHQALADNQLPTIPTILPTSLEQIQNFFNAHSAVFCKPRVGSAAKHPVLHSIGLGIEINQSVGDDIKNYIKTIPTPTSDVYYKKFTSYADFIAKVDVENFLEIQQSSKSLRMHQCILQQAMDFDFIKYYTGWVNGNGDIIGGKSEAIELLGMPLLKNHVYRETIQMDNFRGADFNLSRSKNGEVRQMAQAILVDKNTHFDFVQDARMSRVLGHAFSQVDWYLLEIMLPK
jgi:hypothetical protein